MFFDAKYEGEGRYGECAALAGCKVLQELVRAALKAREHRSTSGNIGSPKLPTAWEFVDMVQATVPEPLTRRERGLLGKGYLIICRQLRAGA